MIGWFCAVLAASPALGQPAGEVGPAQEPPGELIGQFPELGTELQKLGDWDDEAQVITHTIERYWSENKWDTEADQFAGKTAREVTAIPPWNVTGRLDKMTELLSDRYRLTETQHGRLQSSLHAEAGWFLAKNYKFLFGQTKEFVSMRSAGQPLTPELVARWMQEAEPLVADARERLDRMVKSMEKTMTPEQREILRRDQESLLRREAFFDQMRRRWAEGGWEPRDWGLENDPLYAGWQPDARQREILKRRAALEAARARQAALQAVDETQWERYVREFIQTYQLDEGQRRTAYSILRELQARARDYRESRREEIARLPRHVLATDPLGEPLRRMFGELKTRLEPIPTAAQREAAPTSA
ncbi:MAG: hypothetical protein V2A79_06785 [Planctomycetota bacterium]